jgi:hypothetical protein
MILINASPEIHVRAHVREKKSMQALEKKSSKEKSGRYVSFYLILTSLILLIDTHE